MPDATMSKACSHASKIRPGLRYDATRRDTVGWASPIWPQPSLTCASLSSVTQPRQPAPPLSLRLINIDQFDDQFPSIKSYRFCDLYEFNDVKTALACFIFGYEGLRASKAARHLLLRQPGGRPAGDQELLEPRLTGRTAGTWHGGKPSSGSRLPLNKAWLISQNGIYDNET